MINQNGRDVLPRYPFHLLSLPPVPRKVPVRYFLTLRVAGLSDLSVMRQPPLRFGARFRAWAKEKFS